MQQVQTLQSDGNGSWMEWQRQLQVAELGRHTLNGQIVQACFDLGIGKWYYGLVSLGSLWIIYAAGKQ